MDRYDYAEKISDLLDKACGELSALEFELLLSSVQDITSSYE